MKRIQLLIIIGLPLVFQQLASAQIIHNQTYLENVGTLDSIYSKVLQEYRHIYVQLPNSHISGSHEKYPVVFILDGEVLLPTLNNVHDFYSGGFMPEMVLVGVANNKHRTRDLTTSVIKTKYGMPFSEENGKAIKFVKFMEDELIPFIENKYPVTEYKTLIGHSYAGLFTLFTLIHFPYLFDNYLAIDPSLDWDDQKLVKESKIVLPNQNFKGKSMFMSLSGQLHMQDPQITIENVMEDTSDFTLFSRSNIAFSDLVKENSKNGLTYEWKFYPKDLHGTVSFPSIMDGLISLFEWYQMENTYKVNSVETSMEELFNIITYREKKLKSHFGYPVAPYPEDLLIMLGYMNLDMQQSEKSKMYFEFAIEYYPKSANAYDSMADYYLEQKDNENALRYVTKAYNLSRSDYYKNRIDELKQ